ncbi:phage holin family protein [Corynebacterium breve]|uniref:Phage holin family protein n=1 Tax=Corynebacterium breve TaxID=3049799 RepID=A0ABY8VIA1_9CORY|nr:phage holin family protein [Corynebacterium breve]WIM67939.1 phage holin family protein [Corynebacterium breve]
MSNKGLYTDGSDAVSAKVNAIPLRDVDSTRPGENSIGQLVSNATEQMSALVRSEVELAKTEIAGEVKKGAVGGGAFGVAGAIALYSSFFFFFFLAELLAVWLDDRWAAFLIVFLIMLVVAAIAGFFGYQKVKNIKKPERTIDSVNELKSLVPGKAQKNLAKDSSSLYT